jgi:hypothetical protein
LATSSSPHLSMNHDAVIAFAAQLREARENAVRDSEAFDGIIHVVERLGSFLHPSGQNLGKYKAKIGEEASRSALSNDIPRCWPGLHSPFSRLYDLVRVGRNDAVHQGAFARRLTRHAVELAIMLEDAMRRSMNNQTVGDYMVRNPICAELWQPISFVGPPLGGDSYSFMPVKRGTDWFLISDLQIATHLGMDEPQRKEKLTQSLEAAKINMQPARSCTIDTPIENALTMLDGRQEPLLVCVGSKDLIPIGIITPFDFL